jgi:hypothetical protein
MPIKQGGSCTKNGASQLFSNYHLATLIDAMNLKNRLSQISTYCLNIYISCLFFFSEMRNTTIAPG